MPFRINAPNVFNLNQILKLHRLELSFFEFNGIPQISLDFILNVIAQISLSVNQCMSLSFDSLMSSSSADHR